MNIFARRKGTLQVRVVRDVRHHSQFDLRIVGRNNDALCRDKGFAHAPPSFRAHRYVLQIGLRRR